MVRTGASLRGRLVAPVAAVEFTVLHRSPDVGLRGKLAFREELVGVVNFVAHVELQAGRPDVFRASDAAEEDAVVVVATRER